MKRLIFSTLSILLATSVVAPSVEALPQVKPGFKIQTLRLQELDTRNKSEDDAQPYYPYEQAPSTAKPQSETAEQALPAEAETSASEEAESNSAASTETEAQAPTVTERRLESLDRS